MGEVGMKKITTYILILAMMFICIVPALADSLSDAQRQKSKIDSSLSGISKQKQQLQKQKEQLEEDKNQILKQKDKNNAEYKNILSDLDDAQKQLSDLEDSLAKAEDNYNSMEELFKSRLRAMYENASGSSYLDTLLESKSLVDFLGKIELISTISKSDKEMVKKLDSTKEELTGKKKLKEELEAVIQDKASKKKQTLSNLRESQDNLEDKIAKSKEIVKKLEAQEDEMLKRSKSLESQIKALQQKGTKYSGGIMLWPSNSSTMITSAFGNRYHPVTGVYKMHTGIDIGAAYGTSILAANKGTVIVAGWDNAYGNCIIIDHGGGITTLYGHSSKLCVSVGQTVSKGEVIGKVGSTGLSTGPHLHFEVRKNGAPVNPLSYVSP
jgi:murein DD-endopeptidase MepM/ murein hydrolase activator NlpD